MLLCRRLRRKPRKKSIKYVDRTLLCTWFTLHDYSCWCDNSCSFFQSLTVWIKTNSAITLEMHSIMRQCVASVNGLHE